MEPVTPKTKTNLSPKRRWHQKLILQISLWVLASVASVIILLGVVVVVLLHNERFHNYVLNTARKQATEALGVRVQLQNYALNLSDLSLDVYGVTVDGASPYANPPLLQVDHAQVGVRVVSILHGKWHLDSVRVDRPIARVFVDEHGVSNIPTIKSSGKSSRSTSLFDIAIRRAVLDRGEIYYNNKQSVLAADLHDVELRASFDSILQKYSGRLVYSDGHLISGSLKPIPHNLEAEFDATPTTFHLTNAKLTSGGSQAVLAATLQNYNSPNVEAHYDLLVDGNEIKQILQNASIPTGLIRATGTVVYQQSSVRTVLDSIQVQGDLTSTKLDVSAPSLRTQVTNLAAHYSLTNSDVTLKDFRVNLLGGQLTATGTMSKLGADSKSTVKAALHGLSLSELKRLSGNSASMNSVSLSGVLNADAVASWGKTFDDLIAKTDVSIHGQVMSAIVKGTQTSGQTQATIPIESMIHGTYSGASKQISLAKSYVRTPQTNLTLDGVVSDRSTLSVRLQADDLHEIETIADVFRTAAPGQSLQPFGLAGTASFLGAVTGSTSSPHLSGQFLATDFQVHGTTWKLLRTNVDLSPSLASLQHAELRPESGGSITFNASSGLTKWAFSNTSPVQVDLDVAQLDIPDIAKLAGQQIPVTGKLNASLKLHGTELSPVGNGSISLANLVAYTQPISSARLTFSGTGDDVQGDLAVQLPAGKLLSKMTIKPRQKTYIATVSADGIQLDKLQALKAQNIDAIGTLAIKASGQGTFDNPQMYATVQIPQLNIQKQTITSIDLRMNVANHLANATLSSSAVNTNIQAKAQVQLTGEYLADATLDTQGIPLQPILAVYASEQAANVTGQTEVHATLHGPLKDKNHLEGHVTIPILKVAYGNSIQLAAASPIHIDYKDGIVALQRSTIKGTDTDLEFQGSIPTIGNGPMSVMLKGTVNLQLAQLFDPDVRTSGELQFNINSNGPRDGSNFGGEIKIVEAAFATADVPVGLQHGNGVLTLANDRLNISSFQGTVGGGAVTAQGGVLLRPNIQFNLGLAAKDMRILYPQGMRESVNANLRLAGSPDSAVLGGTIALSDLSFTSGFDLNDFISQFSGGVASPPTPGFSQNLQLNLAVRSTNNVALVSRTLSIDGAANLQVRGTAARPVILGRVNLNNGDIILNGTRFLLNGGTVEFVNPNETQPVVNLALKTTIQQYDVYLRFNGPVDQLRTNYSSDPALPSADIINLLAFGKTTEASAVSGQSTSTTQAAQSLIASQVSSQVTSRISKIAGISQLSINPVLAGGTNQGQAGANITIQQRVTGNLFITYSTNVASTQSQTIQGQYQVSPRVAVSATRDQNGGFAVDTLIKKTW